MFFYWEKFYWLGYLHVLHVVKMKPDLVDKCKDGNGCLVEMLAKIITTHTI